MVSISILNYINGFILFLLPLMTIIDLGLIGKHLTYYNDLVIQVEKEFYERESVNVWNSMNAIMVFNMFFLLFVPFLTVAAYKYTQPKLFYGMIAIYFILIWLARFISSIAFLESCNE